MHLFVLFCLYFFIFFLRSFSMVPRLCKDLNKSNFIDVICRTRLNELNREKAPLSPLQNCTAENVTATLLSLFVYSPSSWRLKMIPFR